METYGNDSWFILIDLVLVDENKVGRPDSKGLVPARPLSNIRYSNCTYLDGFVVFFYIDVIRFFYLW